MEKVDQKDLKTFKGTCLSLQYSGNTSAKIKKQKLVTFMTYINNVDHFMRFSHEDVKDNRLAFLANQYCTHTKSYFLNEHRALQHQLLCRTGLWHSANQRSRRRRGGPWRGMSSPLKWTVSQQTWSRWRSSSWPSGLRGRCHLLQDSPLPLDQALLFAQRTVWISRSNSAMSHCWGWCHQMSAGSPPQEGTYFP